MHASFSSSYYPTYDTIVVIDLCEPYRMSVTNDAEYVVAEVVKQCGNKTARVIYRDSDGRWDELVHDNGVFVRFAPGDSLNVMLTQNLNRGEQT